MEEEPRQGERPWDALLSSSSGDEEDSGGELDMVLVGSTEEANTVPRAEGAKASVAFEAASLFAFTVNYIFGAGVLGVPYAIANGGILVSSLALAFSSALCLVAMMWILEAQERAKVALGHGPDAVVEFSDMCKFFIGDGAQRVYEISLTIFVVCSSWMYAAIFSVSLAKTLPLFSNATECDLSSHEGFLWSVPQRACWGDYLIYMFLFAGAMSVLVRTDIAAMKSLQLALTCVGLTALVTMIATVLAAMPGDGISELSWETKFFNASNFGSVFGTFVFAQLCHHGVPLLYAIPKRKSIVRPVFVGVILTTTTMYLMLGVLCALFFGVGSGSIDPPPVNKLITLDWEKYTAGKLTAGAFATFVSYFVRLYPAVTCGAAFPLYVITLGNGWFQLYHRGGEPGDVSRNPFYMIAMVPAILFGSVMADVGFMLLFVGLSAFVIAFFMPPLLQLRSLSLVPSLEQTLYSGFYSSRAMCYLCLAFAVVATIFTLYSRFA